MAATGRWWPRSVRARTTLVAAVVVSIALVASAVGLLLTLSHSLTRSGDDLSKSRIADLAALVSAGTLPRTLTNVGEDSVAQVVDSSAQVLSASANLGDAGPISTVTPRGDRPMVQTLHDVPDYSETETYRVWARRAEGPNGKVTVYVGRSLESVRETVATLRRSLLVGLPLLLGLLALSTWVMIGRALRPVEGIRAEVSAISDQSLNRRVPIPSTDDEVGRLAKTMNDMLDRLEAGSRRQRKFVADASHELQSPLAAMRAQLEVELAHPNGTNWLTTARSLLTDSDRMERLVRDLLFLARADAAPRQPYEALDLDDIVLEEAARLRATAVVELVTAGVSGAPVQGSRDDLSRLVRNLLENAAAHAEKSVTVELNSNDDGVLLTVTDDGPGVAPADRSLIFERFYRADNARSPQVGGTGLGLSIARTITASHGGILTLEPSQRGARFAVRLPHPS